MHPTMGTGFPRYDEVGVVRAICKATRRIPLPHPAGAHKRRPYKWSF